MTMNDLVFSLFLLLVLLGHQVLGESPQRPGLLGHGLQARAVVRGQGALPGSSNSNISMLFIAFRECVYEFIRVAYGS